MNLNVLMSIANKEYKMTKHMKGLLKYAYNKNRTENVLGSDLASTVE